MIDLEQTYTIGTAVLLALLLLALLAARVISPLERRLVTSAAVVLAGAFFVTRGAAEPVAITVGTTALAAGLLAFASAVTTWRSRPSSWVGAAAGLVLLPPAFFGAVLVEGLIISLLSH